MNYTEKVIIVLELLKKGYLPIRFMRDVLKLKDCEVKAIIADLRHMGYQIKFYRNSGNGFYKMTRSIDVDCKVMKEYAVYAVMDLWYDIIKNNLQEVMEYVSELRYEPYYLKGYREFHGITSKHFHSMVLKELKEHHIIAIDKERGS